uniref:Muellerian-inhibiting factor n=1 Tax=Callorhinchus milii TaxID=7868 RepID=A0A4W3GTZ1_CALMI|eukprot:gi/632961688/ref/XP_007896900.1/ PREDICTED: muellerian-inhibiting factor [Callorhinchus milii]
MKTLLVLLVSQLSLSLTAPLPIELSTRVESADDPSVSQSHAEESSHFNPAGTEANYESDRKSRSPTHEISPPSNEDQGPSTVANRSRDYRSDTFSEQYDYHSRRRVLGGFEEPVCRLHMAGGSDRRPNPVEIVGLVTGYERGFIEDVRQYSDGHMARFGICSDSSNQSALPSLTNLALHLEAGAQVVRLTVLHLSEMNWKEHNLQLQFKTAYQWDLDQPMDDSEMSLLVFYLGQRQDYFFENREGFRFAELQLDEHQTVCFYEQTKYVILNVQGIPGKHSDGQLCFEVSLKISSLSNGTRPVKERLQQLLFGLDEKRFTRMTPALYLLTRKRKPTLQPSCNTLQDATTQLSLDKRASRTESDWDVSDLLHHPGPSGRVSPRDFLRHLNSFLNMVLDYSTDWRSKSIFHLDKETIESLPHQSLNISNIYALELLVELEEPLVFLLPENAEVFLEDTSGENSGESRKQEEKIQRLFLTKMQGVIAQVLAIPVFQKEKVLKKLRYLLNQCNYPFPLPQVPQVPTRVGDAPKPGQRERNRKQKTYHTFLLLKTLQTVKTFWDKKQKLFRQNRSAGNRSVCKLEELSIDFERLSYDWILIPKLYNIHNCVGPCRVPLIGNVSNHVVLLIKMQEQGLPTKREPCCVPVEYSELLLAVVSDHSSEITIYKNMVAEDCKCR